MSKINFEKALTRLEEITQKLESADFSLEDSLKLFEEGIRLSRFCQKTLSEAEKKIELLKSLNIEDYEDNSSEETLNEDNEDTIESRETVKKRIKKRVQTTNGTEESIEGKGSFLF